MNCSQRKVSSTMLYSLSTEFQNTYIFGVLTAECDIFLFFFHSEQMKRILCLIDLAETDRQTDGGVTNDRDSEPR